MESRDPVENWSDDIHDVCITELGKYHVSQLINFFPYLDAVSVDTPIMDDKARLEVRDVRSLIDRLHRCAQFVDYLNKCADTILDPAVRTLWKSAYTQAMESMATIQDRAHEAMNAEEDS